MSNLMELLKVLEHSYLLKQNIKVTPEWFAGFIEAEGHFHGKVGQQPFFTISQHAADYQLMETLSEYIGHGKVRLAVRPDGRSEAILTIYNKEVLKNKIIPICSEHFITKNKSAQFMEWVNAHFPEYKSIVLPNSSKSIHPQWLAGFVDGDGSFYTLTHKAKDYKCGYQVQAVFDIAQLDSERSLLNRIGKEIFGSHHKWAKSKDTQHLRIMSQKGLFEKVEPFFDNNKLLTRKRFDFVIWKEMLKTIKNKEHTTIEGLAKINELRELQNHYRLNVSSGVQELINQKLNVSLKVQESNNDNSEYYPEVQEFIDKNSPENE